MCRLRFPSKEKIPDTDMAKLGVNIDHVATLREARKGSLPDPLEAAFLCERAGCDSIVCHLREDRRHIKDEDLVGLRKSVGTRLNLEMSTAADIIKIAIRVCPDQATIVPERRQEVTTEGGLDVRRHFTRVKKAVHLLRDAGIDTSLFINADKEAIDYSVKAGASIIELHTGEYANALGKSAGRKLAVLRSAADYAFHRGLEVNAGHGLDYLNTASVAKIDVINELNIGYSIICRAVIAGIETAVREMLELVR